MQRALLGGTLVALMCAMVGVFITLRKESFLTDAVAHASLSGIAIALVLNLQPLPVAIVVGVAMSIMVTYFRKNSKISADALIGIFYSVLFALGILILNLGRAYQPEISTYLFGSLLSITNSDLIVTIVAFLIVFIFLIINYTKLIYITFDVESAFLKGIKVNLMEYLLAAAASVAIVISIKLVGVVLASALLIIPASSAKLLASKFSQMMPLTILASMLAFLIGIAAAYNLDTVPGASIVLSFGVIFFCSFFLSKFKKK